jgi:ubiquitin C-terminal hydrolase
MRDRIANDDHKLLKQRSSSTMPNGATKRGRSGYRTNTVILETVAPLHVSANVDGPSRSRSNLRHEPTSSFPQSHATNGTVTARGSLDYATPLESVPPQIVPRRIISPAVVPRTNVPNTVDKEESPTPTPRERLSRTRQRLDVSCIVSDPVTESPILTASMGRSPRSLPRNMVVLPTPNTRQPIRCSPGICGLTNNGNTCFMNSALQCLSNIPDLRVWAKDQHVPIAKDGTNIVHAYCRLIQAMWSGKEPHVNPQEIKDIVSRSAPMFSDHGQKDSHEFMNSLLNALERTEAKPIVADLFYIHTQSQVTCGRCQSIDQTDQTTTFLPLPLTSSTSNRHETSLERLIQDFSREEDLTGLYYCHHCSQYTHARQKTTIQRSSPRVLIVQLQRFPFDGTDRKVETFVRYQLEYDHLLSNNDPYRLCAVSVHVGSLASGHYTTFARHETTDRWYQFNDLSVVEINADTVVTRNAYILVYVRSDGL